MKCIIDGQWGIYIPQTFCQRYHPEDWGFARHDQNWKSCLAGPDDPYYWESWDTILNNARTSWDGEAVSLYQASDLFIVRDDEIPEEG